MSFTLHKSQKYLEFSAVLPDVVTNWGPQPNSHQALHVQGMAVPFPLTVWDQFRESLNK
jgi:hypothetical protein